MTVAKKVHRCTQEISTANMMPASERPDPGQSLPFCGIGRADANVGSRQDLPFDTSLGAAEMSAKPVVAIRRQPVGP
ncbi:hypothetical protein [Sphingobium sp. GW456-12-10-14-TSB1]|uniref:hypothetical protein n=1 Tax=Sphingobium sp. GW456-12-10-14-TSB1 TaxID=1987165 RepID=UPI001593E544|nr:hypothetical protein [Sphingobium sp. GW456-12-10-14-TSB1]